MKIDLDSEQVAAIEAVHKAIRAALHNEDSAAVLDPIVGPKPDLDLALSYAVGVIAGTMTTFADVTDGVTADEILDQFVEEFEEAL